MTPILTGPFYGCCLLLAGAGVEKGWRPEDTARGLRMAGLKVPPSAVRAGGAAEALIATAAILTGDRLLAGLVAVSYAAFAGFVVWAMRRRAPLSSCGCFGRADTPPTITHVAVNVACCAVAAGVTESPIANVTAVLARQPLAGLPLAVLSAAVAFAAFLLLGPAARLQLQRPASAGRRP